MLSASDSPLVRNDNVCSSKRKMFVYYQNVRGLRSKLTELYQSSLACNYHIISISETWLNSSVFNDEILCPRYQIFRSDRNYEALNSSRGGGVLLAVSNEFRAQQLDLSNLRNNISVNIDVVGVKVDTGFSTIVAYTIYIPTPEDSCL